MSSISSVGSYTSTTVNQRMHRPDPSKMVDKLFSELDTTSKGYLEKSDLQSAFSQLSGSGSSSGGASVDEVFKQLDSDGDGKVTKDEMSSSLQKIADQLDSQFDQMRMSGGGMPPPPPGGGKNDSGFSKDELKSQLSEIGSSDSKHSDLISKIVNNFEAADTDSDGKVSFKEAMAYDQKTRSSSATSTDGSASSTSSTSATNESASSEQAIMKRIMELMQAYSGNDSNKTSLLGSLSVSA